MVDAYLEWDAKQGDRAMSDYQNINENGVSENQDGGERASELYCITVVDVFCKNSTWFLVFLLTKFS